MSTMDQNWYNPDRSYQDKSHYDGHGRDYYQDADDRDYRGTKDHYGERSNGHGYQRPTNQPTRNDRRDAERDDKHDYGVSNNKRTGYSAPQKKPEHVYFSHIDNRQSATSSYNKYQPTSPSGLRNSGFRNSIWRNSVFAGSGLRNSMRDSHLSVHNYQKSERQWKSFSMMMALEPQATFASAPKSDEKGIEVEDEVIPEWKPKKQEWAIMLTLSLLSLLVALDATVLVTGLPVLAEALNGTTVEAFWAGASYLLSSAVFQPVIASISAQFGRQQLLLISLTFFTVGTVFCAVAHNFTILLAGRSIQGIGGGGIVTMSQVIFCDIVPLRVRPKYFAIVLGAWAIGSIIGPVIGGVIIEHTTWRWLFYINFPFCALGFIFVPLCIKLTAVTKLTFSEKLRKIDWIGAFIFVGSMTSFLMGLSWAGVQYEWKSFQTLVPISVGVGGLFVFVAWEYFVGENSLLPLSLFYCWSAAAAFYCALINGLLLFTALYYFPFYLMSVKASMPTHAGVELFPALACLVPGSIIVSLLTTRLGRYRWAIWIGWSITTGGAGMLIPFFKLDTNMTVFAGVLAVFGVGTGMVLTSVNFAIQSISRPEDSAMAASVYGFFRSLGMPIGVAVGGTVFTNGMSSKLTDLHLPTIIAHQAEGYVQKLHTMADTDPLKIGVLEAYAHGFRGIWYFMACAAGSALLVSFIIQSFSMDKLFKSSFTTRPDSDTFSLVGTVKEKGDDFA